MDVVVTKFRIDDIARFQPRFKTKETIILTELLVITNTSTLLTGHKRATV